MDTADVADELWAKFGRSKGKSPAQGNILGNSDPKTAGGPGQTEPVKPYLAKG